MLWPTPPAVPGLTSADVEIQLYKITKQAAWLKKMTSSTWNSFDLFDFD